ncbi:alpha/beta hydrolase [Sporosarcina sp.]|uniref:alpha/beta fold hydrolase n=1 Tax=Sporosarcina sp. TaxID=49982 RepID=UPI0026224E69|nr:alpha/beta hydrolase [Sporosarcina sp.]
MEKKFILTESGYLSYWFGGKQSPDAKCLVFVHGMTADHSMFDKQVECFRNEYKIIMLDLPLHGESRNYINFTLSNIADVLDALLELENISEVTVIGQSLGGYVCQEFGIRYPEKVKGFVGIDTTPFGHDYYPKWERAILSKISFLSSLIPYKTLIKSISKGATRTDYAYANMYSSVSKLSKKEIINIMDVSYNELLKRTKTAEFTFPVLLVIGENDHTGNVKKYNYKWSARSGHPVAVISDAAHNSNVDNYNEFNRVLAGFLSM